MEKFGGTYSTNMPPALYKNLAIIAGAHRRTGPLRHSRRSARVRSAHRQGSLALPRRAAAGRRELRHLGPQRLAGSARPGRLGADDGRSGERPGVHRARQRDRSELRQQPARRESLRHVAAGAAGVDRQAQVALPDDAPRHLRLGPRVAAGADRGDEGRTARAGRRADDQAGPALHVPPADRRAAVRRRGAARCRGSTRPAIRRGRRSRFP